MCCKPIVARPCYRQSFHKKYPRLIVLQIWILAAQFEVRQLRMVEARKILGMSLGMCPKDRTYKAYIEVACLAPADAPMPQDCTCSSRTASTVASIVSQVIAVGLAAAADTSAMPGVTRLHKQRC